MAKFFLIAGLVVGLFFSFLFVRKIMNFDKDMESFSSTQQGKEKTPFKEKLESQGKPEEKPEENPEEKPDAVSFSFVPNDPVLGTANSPHAGQGLDLQKGRATVKGFVEKSHQGVSRVRSGPDAVEFVVTDAGRDIHREEVFHGFSKIGGNYYVQGDFPEAKIRGISGLPGAYVGKVLPTGTIEFADPAMVVVLRKDGARTFISAGVSGVSSKPAMVSPQVDPTLPAAPPVLDVPAPPEPPATK